MSIECGTRLYLSHEGSVLSFSTFIEVWIYGPKVWLLPIFAYIVATNVSYLVWTFFGHLEMLIVISVLQSRYSAPCERIVSKGNQVNCLLDLFFGMLNSGTSVKIWNRSSKC